MRRLTLKKETVAELTTGELTSVVGAASVVKYCQTLLTCGWSEVDACITAQGCYSDTC